MQWENVNATMRLASLLERLERIVINGDGVGEVHGLGQPSLVETSAAGIFGNEERWDPEGDAEYETRLARIIASETPEQKRQYHRAMKRFRAPVRASSDYSSADEEEEDEPRRNVKRRCTCSI